MSELTARTGSPPRWCWAGSSKERNARLTRSSLSRGHPVFWGRGSADTVIANPAVARTEAWLPAHTTLTRRSYPGLAHAINADEAADVREFLHQIVGP